MNGTKNRRKGSRRPVKVETAFGVVTHHNRKIPVLLINESLGGMGVLAVNAPELPVGAIVHFEAPTRRIESRVASVRHTNLEGAVVTRLGLEWTD